MKTFEITITVSYEAENLDAAVNQARGVGAYIDNNYTGVLSESEVSVKAI